MKIVLLDGEALNPGDLSWAPLEALGQLTVYPQGTNDPDEVIRRIGDADVVLCNKTPVGRRVFENCPSIRLLCVVATGYNVVDTAAAKEFGIPVCNVPAYGTEMVAQFAIGLLLEVCHHVGLHNESVHAGEWERCPNFCYWKTPIMELAGKTMGIIGFGRIGRAVGRIAKALGMHVLATGSRECPEGLAIAEYTDLDTVLKEADVLSLHCPLFPETERMINRDTLAKMKDGAILINNSRGGLIDEQAVADALNAGKLRAAAVDVVTVEPILPSNPLLTAKNCIITPHMSWAATECRQRIVDITAANIRAFEAGSPQNVVNP
ncbi:MAG: D-2-hydroxyacid dehydrogenase [Oscillospiraceae bacterium]|nr:D-2-hydroxyacid dehydrogenase [Oscillospiraceae bacterium]